MAAPQAPILYCARYLLPIGAPPLAAGALLVEGGTIRAVGARRDLAAAHPHATLVDFGDAVLLPPLVNAHTHLELSDFPAWVAAAGMDIAPRDFVDWILHLVRVKRTVSAEQLQDSLAAGLRASLLAGTGAVGDILTSLEAAAVYRATPLRGRLFAEVLGYDQAAVAERLALIAELVPTAPTPELSWGLSPHAPYTLSAATTDQVFAFARSHALQCAMHLAESRDETRFLRDAGGAIAKRLFAAARWLPKAAEAPGCSPVRALCRQGRLRRGDLAVHGVQVDSADIALLGQTGCSVVLCPRSNAALKVGKAPVAAYLAAGVPLALGTDSLASAPSLSIWHELAFARECFSGQVGPRDWLRMATLGGARALGLEQRMGQLAAGLDAAFQVVTLPQLPAIDQLEEALCAAGQELTVTHLFLGARNVLPQS